MKNRESILTYGIKSIFTTKAITKLSPQQIQLMKLLQIPTAYLEERIKEELEENPALETGEEQNEDEFDEDLNGIDDNYNDDHTEEETYDADDTVDNFENIDISEYVSDGDDDVADYRTRDDNYPEMDEQKPCHIRWKPLFTNLCSTSSECFHSTKRP